MENEVTGNVQGPVVQAHTIHELHLNSPRPARPVGPPPSSWAERPELPDEILHLLAALQETAEDMPYQLPESRTPSLGTVYVRQDLGTGVEEPQPEQQHWPAQVVDDNGQVIELPAAPVARVAVRPPSRPLREALDRDRHLLITGGPGLGKSTLTLRLAAEIAAHWTAPSGEPPLVDVVLPLRVTARELAARLDLPFASALADSACAEYGGYLAGRLDDLLGGAVAGCPWLLLVDGLDEVASNADRAQLVRVLAKWAKEPFYRVMLTTRPIEGAALGPLQRGGAARYELQPFDETALCDFAENWFGATVAERFLHQIREAHLDELVCAPLFATVAAIIFDRQDEHPLPDNEFELYESYLEILSSRETPPGPFTEHRIALLEHLGRVRLETDKSLIAAARDWVVRHLSCRTDALTQFLINAGPLKWIGDDLRFLHHSFAEHLAATARAKELPDRFDPAHEDFNHLLHNARRWDHGRHDRQVLLHYTRLHHGEADRLIRWLHDGTADQHLLAARLLAKHVPAGRQEVDDFLVTVHGWAMTTQWQARRILERTSRATHHPGLVEWLVALMRNESAPWRSRAEAATALAIRLRVEHSAEALELLREIVDDPAISVEHRLTAAEALSHSGSAERETAERGLRAVLADELASAAECRTAAVVLAGFGDGAREEAVAALIAIVGDDYTGARGRVEVASGLMEIGVEYFDLAAQVFTEVLRSSVRDTIGREDAARGLASLGPAHLEEAVVALRAMVEDRRFDHSDRAWAARTIGVLAPQYRELAAEIISAVLAEPDLQYFERVNCADHLAALGPQVTAAVAAHLRSIIADRRATANNLYFAAMSLADLGPRFHAEAADVLWQVADDPVAGVYEGNFALGRLVRLGEPYRTPALERLRTLLRDPRAEVEARIDAASQLVQAGPEVHPEVAHHLLEIATREPTPDVAVRAWRTLQNLSTVYRDRAASALLSLARSSDVDEHQLLDGTRRRESAELLLKILNDPARTVSSRGSAAKALSGAGARFGRAATAGVADLLRHATHVDFIFPFIVTSAIEGPGARREVAAALREVLLDPHTPSGRMLRAVKSLDRLGFGKDPDVLTALHTIVEDKSADADVRWDAAVTLAQIDRRFLPTAVEVVLAGREEIWTRSWARAVRELGVLGGDVLPRVRALLSDRDTHRTMRQAAAVVVLGECAEAVTELRSQAGDEHLSFWHRFGMHEQWADVDDAAWDVAVEYMSAVMDDERLMVSHRIYAARAVAGLDRSRLGSAVALLDRISQDPFARATDRETSIGGQSGVSLRRTRRLTDLIIALIHHPATWPSDVQRLSQRLSPVMRAEFERALLMDHSVGIAQRVPEPPSMNGIPLDSEIEAALRDAIAAPETKHGERVTAVVELAKQSVKFIPEAIESLVNLEELKELPKLGPAGWTRAHRMALDVVEDDTKAMRERQGAAEFIAKIDPDPPALVVEFLRTVAVDARTSGRDRVDALYALRNVDGLDRMRAVRDDERMPPEVRRRAANNLTERTVEDRRKCAAVLRAIAADPAVRPALRWRAAWDLTELGAAGSADAAELLRAMAEDPSLPLTTRDEAADGLIRLVPGSRREMLELSRGLLDTPNPLHRRQVLRTIGGVESAEAVRELNAMARDETLSAVARLRCAEAMVELRRDQKEPAAVVARAIARDETVARHVRRHAAGCLARWSEVCREEAREWFREFSSGLPGTR
ncbi:hypothetical protein Lesp02_05960 [Lentzea sp. NBRC 105346]|uniref:NACHT domain-containing protein n=1 Tax=Lentzea sp. NBRC 105346 TaxID=3032205 RepID=UPI0024A08B5C|nr:NACHT domain-containing protein [Lentzea sp. NBRC 105346]GLZ28406.1 hypothetical protein Lesp02_05960 [Lentzea sp. NBRC 105346]